MGIAESRSPTRTGSSNTRNIPDLSNGKGARSLKCCDRGIMRRSLLGARQGAKTILGYAGRTFGSVTVTLGTDLPLARGESEKDEKIKKRIKTEEKRKKQARKIIA